MPSQTRANKEPSQRERMDELTDEDVRATSQKAGADRVTVEDIDELLDEIDSILEENALGFVAAYIQKGGE